MTELERARAYYSQKPAPERAFEFSRYKERVVRRALDELFHRKCAYCESKYSAVEARDVEHYRPKGGVKGLSHPGYWWLAGAWSNLLPSCPGCNRLGYRVMYEPGMSAKDFEDACQRDPDTLTGKGRSFPTSTNRWAMSEDDDLRIEDPLLIDPCEHNPADHLEFIFDFDRRMYIWDARPVQSFVRARHRDGQDDCRGETSIRLYGLNRLELVRQRGEHLMFHLQPLCKPVVDAWTTFSRTSDGSPSEEELKKHCEGYIKSLNELREPSRTYAGMVRAFILEFARDLDRLTIDLFRERPLLRFSDGSP